MNSNLYNQLNAARNLTVTTDPYLERTIQLENTKPAYYHKRSKAIIPYIVIGVIAGLFLWGFTRMLGASLPTFAVNLIFTAGVALVTVILISAHKKKTAAIDSQINAIDDEIHSCYDHVFSVFDSNPAIIGFLPQEYRYTEAIDYMMSMVASDRAATLPQALQLFDEYDHRRTLESQNRQILDQQQLQNAQLQSLNRTAKINAGANIAGTIFSIANKL